MIFNLVDCHPVTHGAFFIFNLGIRANDISKVSSGRNFILVGIGA